VPEIATLAAELTVVRLLSLEPPQPAKAIAATTDVISFIFIVITPKGSFFIGAPKQAPRFNLEQVYKSAETLK
jgi:hypothetical protein